RGWGDGRGKCVPVFEKDSVERADKRRKAIASELFRLCHGEQFDEEAGKLDQMIVGTPCMAVARADGEAEPPIKFGGRVEVAHGMDHVVEPAGHRSRRHFTAENAVGCKSMFLIEAMIGPSRSLSARLDTHSGSLTNLFHFASRSASDSQASR